MDEAVIMPGAPQCKPRETGSRRADKKARGGRGAHTYSVYEVSLEALCHDTLDSVCLVSLVG